MRFRHIVTLVLAISSALSLTDGSACAQGFTAPWVREWADQTLAAYGSIAVDSAGACHIIYFTDGGTGATRWLTRIGPNQWINPLTGQPFPGETPTDNVSGMWRPYIVTDANRNVYITYEQSWAGPIALVMYNYAGSNRWVLDAPPVAIPNASGYWPKIEISASGVMAVGFTGGHDTVQNFPHGISVNTSGNYRGTWTTTRSWTISNVFVLDSLGNINVLENGDNSYLDPYAYLYRDYNYRKYTASMTLLAGPTRITDTGGDGWRTGFRIFAHALAVKGGTVQMVFRIIDNYRGGNNIWLWTLTNGVVTGPVSVSNNPSGWVTQDCNIVASSGSVVATYLAGPDGNTCGVYAWDMTNNLRSGPLDTGIRNTNHMSTLSARGDIYVNSRTTTPSGVQFGFIPAPAGLGALNGYVRDASGAAVAGADVALNGPGGYTGSTNTDPVGFYSIGALYPGTYSATAGKLGYTSQTVDGISVNASQTTTIDFAITASQGTIAGSVRSADGQALSGATVTATGPGTYTAASGADGGYVLNGVATGSYTITAARFGYLGQPSSVTLSDPGQTLSQDFTLRHATAHGVKQLPSGATVELEGKVVTAVFSGDSCIYVEEPDRSSGIRVVASDTGLAVGDVVDVTGTLAVTKPDGVHASEYQVSPSSAVKRSSGAPVEPVWMTCRSVGGGAPGPLAPGVKDGSGLSNIGLLVGIAGRVTSKFSYYIHVDDGSQVADTPGNTGVMVKYTSTSIPANVGDLVTVIGIVEGSIPVNWTENRRYIQVRATGDLVKVGS